MKGEIFSGPDGFCAGLSSRLLANGLVYGRKAILCFVGFLKRNDLDLPLYDPKTGGCRDG